MSGGSHNYICYNIEEELCNQMKDAELNDLIKDIKDLAHDLDWCDSGDITKERYFESVRKFKQKWFHGNREERLKGFIDDAINDVKRHLYTLIGIEIEGSKENE